MLTKGSFNSFYYTHSPNHVSHIQSAVYACDNKFAFETLALITFSLTHSTTTIPTECNKKKDAKISLWQFLTLRQTSNMDASAKIPHKAIFPFIMPINCVMVNKSQ